MFSPFPSINECGFEIFWKNFKIFFEAVELEDEVGGNEREEQQTSFFEPQ